MASRTPPVPSFLETGGRKLWREIAAGRTLRADELRVLLDACAEADLIDDLRAALKGEPRTVSGSMGQIVAHPLIAELRQHRGTLARLLAGLKLADTDTSAATAGQKVRESARSLARARWEGKGA